jgi:LEA14-like dessication related protein
MRSSASRGSDIARAAQRSLAGQPLSDPLADHQPSRRNLLRRGGGMALLAALAGCASLEPPLKAPSFAFLDLDLRELSRDRARLGVRVQASNPNPLSIPIAALTFAVDLAGVEIATGAAADAPFVLPARAGRELVFDVDARASRVLEAVRQLSPAALRGGIAWRLHGTARWGSLGLPIPFERNGRLEAARLLRRQTPGASPAQPATP